MTSADTAAPGYRWASDHGLLVTLGDTVGPAVHQRVMDALAALQIASIPGLCNLHPAYASILVVIDPRAAEPAAVEAAVRGAVGGAGARAQVAPRTVEIPVCYEAAHAPDLQEIARAHGLSPGEVVRLHAGADYTVHFLGFAPGFPYLEGLPAQLATPRLPVPRKRVPAGSVAIGGRHAGIYSVETPGGWRVVGRTPRVLFRADHRPPALLSPGDRVRFVPIDARTFELLAVEGAR
jgi:inhibitor of KinA